MYECGFCGGAAIWSPDDVAYVHADDGARVTPSGPGDFVTDRHNRAGSVVLPVDLWDGGERPDVKPLTYTPGPGSIAGRLTGATVWTPESG